MRLDELMKRVWQARGAPGAAIGARPSLDVQVSEIGKKFICVETKFLRFIDYQSKTIQVEMVA